MKKDGKIKMSDNNYEPDIVSIIDEDGKEHVFEELDRIETDNGRYVALLPIPENPDALTEEDSSLIILKVEEEKGEIYLTPIEDDDEFNEVGNIFEDRLSEMFDIESEE